MTQPLEPLGRYTEDRLEEPARAQGWAGVTRRRDRRRLVRRAGVAVAAVAVVAAGTIGLGGGFGRGEALTEAGGSELGPRLQAAADGPPLIVRLSDASRIELSPAGSIEVAENGGARLHLVLREGLSRFAVARGGGRAWSIDCGVALVEVTGTEFVLERSDRGLEIAVIEGTVRVSSDRLSPAVRYLRANERLDVRAQMDHAAGEDAKDAEVGSAGPVIADAPAERAAGAPPDLGAGAAFKPGAGSVREDPAPALSPAGRLGTNDRSGPAGPAARAEDTRDEIDTLLTEADRARREHTPAQAIAPLERVLAIAPRGDPRAPVAAFTLGRTLLEELADPDRAAGAFERSLELGLAGALEETAMVRAAESHARAGRPADARRWAERYLVRFPDGRSREAVRAWVTPR